MRIAIILIFAMASLATADLFDDFEYDTPADGGWNTLVQEGTIANISITSFAHFTGEKALLLESENREHFQEAECDRRKYVAVEKALPDATLSVTFAYRFSVYWQGLGWDWNHGESAGYSTLGLRDGAGCTSLPDPCIDACGNHEFLRSSEWVDQGLEWDYDLTATGSDGETWYLLTLEVPAGADLETLMLDFFTFTVAWSQSSDYAFTHIRLYVDSLEVQTGSASALGSWSLVKALY